MTDLKFLVITKPFRPDNLTDFYTARLENIVAELRGVKMIRHPSQLVMRMLEAEPYFLNSWNTQP